MSVERDIVDEIDAVLARIRRAEQNIITMDYPDKLRVVGRLVDLEESVKSISGGITIPEQEIAMAKIVITEDTLIEALQRENLLSERAGNILRRSGCNTIKDVTMHTTRELLCMRHMGKKSADEIIEFLRLFGFSLKHSKESEA